MPARWYWCSPGARPFPSPHGAEASAWLGNYEINRDWGEVTPYPTDRDAEHIRGLDRGLNPGYPGQCYIGDRQWFNDGRLPAGILEGPVPPMPVCCRTPSAASVGGLVLGGSGAPLPPALHYAGRAAKTLAARSLARHSYRGLALKTLAVQPGTVPCAACAGGRGPAFWSVTVAGGTGQFAGNNGTWLLPWFFTLPLLCGWELPQSPATDFTIIELAKNTAGTGFFSLNNASGLPVLIARYTTPSLSCSLTTSAWTPTTAVPGQPTTIIATPYYGYVASTYKARGAKVLAARSSTRAAYSGRAAKVLAASSSAGRMTKGCAACSGGAPLNWKVVLAGGTGDFAVLNGTWSVPYVSGCIWQLQAGGIQIRLQNFAPNWRLNTQTSSPLAFTSAQSANVATIPCLGTSSFVLGKLIGTGNPPTSATVSPG